jgi:hypothetical protein
MVQLFLCLFLSAQTFCLSIGQRNPFFAYLGVYTPYLKNLVINNPSRRALFAIFSNSLKILSNSCEFPSNSYEFATNSQELLSDS